MSVDFLSIVAWMPPADARRVVARCERSKGPDELVDESGSTLHDFARDGADIDLRACAKKLRRRRRTSWLPPSTACRTSPPRARTDPAGLRTSRCSRCSIAPSPFPTGPRSFWAGPTAACDPRPATAPSRPGRRSCRSSAESAWLREGWRPTSIAAATARKWSENDDGDAVTRGMRIAFIGPPSAGRRRRRARRRPRPQCARCRATSPRARRLA